MAVELCASRFLTSLSLIIITLDIDLWAVFGDTFTNIYSGEMAVELCASRFLTSLSLIIITLDIDLWAVFGDKTSVEQHLEMGRKMLSSGQLADALSHYHAAVDGDPYNYLTYFRRATVYLAMGKSKSALPDLEKVIELKPDFIMARLQRGNVFLKQGKYESAEEDFKQVLRKDSSNTDAVARLEQIHTLPSDIDEARHLVDNHNFQPAVQLLDRAIEVSPWDPELRELRAECYIHLGDYFKAIQDIKTTTKLINDNTGAYYRLSDLHYQIGEADEALSEIRECLKLDPDHKDCFPFYKKLKKLVKQMKTVQDKINEHQYGECVEKARKMLKIESRVHSYVFKAKSHICHCMSKTNNFQEAIKACDEVLEIDEHNLEALCDKAEAHIADERYDDAVNIYQKAKNIDGNFHRAVEGMERAQKLLKQSQSRDYYKILGVKRNAQKKEIMKAYRKLAAKWHPDKYEGIDKTKAEKMFIDLAAAKEVLTDPEKRGKFDNGEDPLDSEQQQKNPFFHQGFNPFGSDGFNFKFHFN